ncbi:YbhB/YbcL family Raf kinase inhibitor-like protein [Glaciibacter sp. 2TAF33]|uniref:YbhB/YbcL family Raf kinase inhibitor-like protein n=1 Tax=Glaciibacter sp. 2TAF33 TaxID=3233015 RepID=UPI003F8E1217
MEFHSASFGDNQEIPQKYGKKSQNVSPQLSWTDAPAGTRSFAVSVTDNHPVARGYLHWLLAGIDGNSSELAEGASASGLPAPARELEPYAGPFPPAGTHEYEFALYALDLDASDALDLPAGTSLEHFLRGAAGHVLDTAVLRGTFTKAR